MPADLLKRGSTLRSPKLVPVIPDNITREACGYINHSCIKSVLDATLGLDCFLCGPINHVLFKTPFPIIFILFSGEDFIFLSNRPAMTTVHNIIKLANASVHKLEFFMDLAMLMKHVEIVSPAISMQTMGQC